MVKTGIDQLLKIGIILSEENDENGMISHVVKKAVEITNCDVGIFYRFDGELLYPKVEVMYDGKDFEVNAINTNARVPLKLDYKSTCYRAIVNHELVNIKKISVSEGCEFSRLVDVGVPNRNEVKSILAIPMENHVGDVYGVLQLINARDEKGRNIPFHFSDGQLIMSLLSLTLSSLTDKIDTTEMINLLNSFIYVISTAIDKGTSYNANHTRNMVKYGKRFIEYLKDTKNPWVFSPIKEKLFLMSIWLHDIGKLAIPIEIMNKNTRLGNRLEQIDNRFEKIELIWQLDCAMGKITEEELKNRQDKLKQSYQFIVALNNPQIRLTTFERNMIFSIAKETYYDKDCTIKHWLTEDERECLTIEKGTLTEKERKVMENHVVMTEELLNKMKLSPYFHQVICWASSHHELLNGTGYPKHLSGDEIPKEVRLMTILDIFDALTARDRPYKSALTTEEAFFTLDTMVQEGKLDGSILQIFKESMVWN
ncbi:MAG: GAF domain-containing protein [Clostridiales bacterium]|nr:GAF domain-containing protein [Clostridiales bacterium]